MTTETEKVEVGCSTPCGCFGVPFWLYGVMHLSQFNGWLCFFGFILPPFGFLMGCLDLLGTNACQKLAAALFGGV